jgi:hypothetical protein
MDEDEIKDEDKEEEDKEPEADGPDPAKIRHLILITRSSCYLGLMSSEKMETKPRLP